MYTLLIADDEPLEREALRFFVTAADLPIKRIIECANGEEALQAALRYEPELMILDIRMPGLSGHEVLEQIRKHRLDAKVIFQTAYGDFDYAVKALHFGAFEYLVKPARKDRVLEVIRRAICQMETGAWQTQGSAEPPPEPPPNDALIAPTPETGSRELKIIRGCIIDKYNDKITLDKLARDVGFSKYYIAHLFKEHYGQTIMDFLTEVRMGHAKELLVGTDLGIKDIAFRVGYTDPNYFISAFKKHTGMSPGKYRMNGEKP